MYVLVRKWYFFPLRHLEGFVDHGVGPECTCSDLHVTHIARALMYYLLILRLSNEEWE